MSLTLVAAFLTAPLVAAASRPNILFIAVDDWNDWVGCLGHERAITPNLDRLAASDMLFTNAHCAAPLCNPSRTAGMMGRLPSSTGIYNNTHWWRPAHPNAVTLPAYVSYSDAQVGHILGALAAGPNADNTIVVLWSDQGYHLGEKQHWHKFTLWERSTRIPLIIRVPGITRPGSRCGRPMSLVDLYPILLDLCGLPDKPSLDGRSIVPLLQDLTAKWPCPVVCIQEPGNCAVRSEHWRYIRYSDGSEELYNHLSDLDEWTNLAARAEYRAVISDHARWVPKVFVPPAPSKDAYRFDPKAFTWIHRKTGKRTSGRE